MLDVRRRGADAGSRRVNTLATAVPRAAQATPAARLRNWVWPLLRTERRRLGKVALLSCVASLLGLAPAFVARILVDDGALGGDLRTLGMASAMLLVAPMVGLAIEAATRRDYLHVSSGVLFGLRERVFDHLHRLPPTWYAQVGQGDLAARFDGDLAEIQRFSVDAPLALVSGCFTFAALLAAMLWMNPLLTLAALAPLPLQAWFAHGHGRPLEQHTAELRRQSSRLSAYFLDSLRAVKFVQSANGEADRLAGLQFHHRAYRQALFDAQQSGFAQSARQRVSAIAGSALVLGGGGWLLAEHTITVGTLLAFVIFAARAGGPVQTLLGVMAGWQRARVSLDRVGELLDVPAAAPSRGERLTARPRGELRLEAVSFAYPGRARVLDGADLFIPAGSRVLLQGPSGGGKSTLTDLLLRHLRPDAGRLLLDGVDIAHIDPSELRRHVAVVDQDPVFFPGSVADNLRALRPGASDAALQAVLDEAGLPAAEIGLDTPVGASLHALSRGQRMRLALARALLRDPAILILDETTSAVDAATEAHILATVDRRLADRTRIIITHHAPRAGSADAAWQLTRGRFQASPAEGSE